MPPCAASRARERSSSCRRGDQLQGHLWCGGRRERPAQSAAHSAALCRPERWRKRGRATEERRGPAALLGRLTMLSPARADHTWLLHVGCPRLVGLIAEFRSHHPPRSLVGLIHGASPPLALADRTCAEKGHGFGTECPQLANSPLRILALVWAVWGGFSAPAGTTAPRHALNTYKHL